MVFSEMKKEIQLVYVIAFSSLILTGCAGQRRDCVDQLGNRRPDIECNRGTAGSRFIYGGSPIGGGRISGGSYDPGTGSRAGGVGSSTSRGGFGSFGGGGS